MSSIKLVSAAALAIGLVSTAATATAAPNGAKFKQSMQNASQARLNNNGSNVLRFEADQELTMRGTTISNSTVRANAVHVDDSLISNLDIDQDVSLRQTTIRNSSVTMNSADMTRARSIDTEIDQEVKLRNVTIRNSNVAANLVSVR